jgi:hypothetical protein
MLKRAADALNARLAKIAESTDGIESRGTPQRSIELMCESAIMD